MKTRRHHNNSGFRQIKRGKTRSQVAAIARRLGIPLKRASLPAGGSADTGAVAGRLIAERSTSEAGAADPDRLAVSNNGRPKHCADSAPEQRKVE